MRGGPQPAANTNPSTTHDARNSRPAPPWLPAPLLRLESCVPRARHAGAASTAHDSFPELPSVRSVMTAGGQGGRRAREG